MNVARHVYFVYMTHLVHMLYKEGNVFVKMESKKYARWSYIIMATTERGSTSNVLALKHLRIYCHLGWECPNISALFSSWLHVYMSFSFFNCIWLLYPYRFLMRGDNMITIVQCYCFLIMRFDDHMWASLDWWETTSWSNKPWQYRQ